MNMKTMSVSEIAALASRGATVQQRQDDIDRAIAELSRVSRDISTVEIDANQVISLAASLVQQLSSLAESLAVEHKYPDPVDLTPLVAAMSHRTKPCAYMFHVERNDRGQLSSIEARPIEDQ